MSGCALSKKEAFSEAKGVDEQGEQWSLFCVVRCVRWAILSKGTMFVVT